MARRTFTDRWLKSVGPFEKTAEFVDAACPNLWLRVGKRRKSFSALIGTSANRRRVPIGQYPEISLVEARKLASEAISDPRAAGGGLPRQGGKQRRATVKELFDLTITAMKTEGKTASIRDYRNYLLESENSALNDFGAGTLACNVTPSMVTEWLARFHERGASTRLPRAILSASFSRGLKADNDPTSSKDKAVKFGIASNPVASVGGPTQSNKRDRSLSREELKAFWSALSAKELPEPARTALQVVIAMGGVRITEVVRSRREWWQMEGDWRFINAPKLALPKTKNGFSHELPVTDAATKTICRILNDKKGRSDFLLPAPLDPEKPLSVETLSRAVAAYCDQATAMHFTPRDLRRTMKNLLLDRDVPQAEVDIWHNHGRNADVARRNYDRAQYEQAKARVRDAIDALLNEL